MTEELIVSASPHIRDRESTAKIMWQVAAALVPAGAWAVYLFGPAVLWVIGLSVGTAVLTEMLCQRLRGVPISVHDGSAVVTGLLLAYVLPSHGVVVDGASKHLTLLPAHVPIIGAFVAIAIAKHCFGGLGHNIWNPALVGRAFVHVAFAGRMNLSEWPWPRGVDAVTQATALAKEATVAEYGLLDLFLGQCPGCIGEVSALLLILGGVYLITRGYVDWRLCVGYLGAALLLTSVLPPRTEALLPASRAVYESWANSPAYHLFAGGLMLGVFFMASDMVTSPLTRSGQLVFGIGCGVLTSLIRFYTGYPEGVCYSILLMNTACPLIDRYLKPTVFGAKTAKAGAKPQ